MFAEKLITAEEFERMVEQPPYSEGLYELIDGEIVQKMPTEDHGLAQVNIATALNLYRKRSARASIGSLHVSRDPKMRSADV